VRFGMRQFALLLAVAGLALGGCGTLSGALGGKSLLEVSAAPVDAIEPVAAAQAPDQTTNAVVTEPRPGDRALVATVKFTAASFEPIAAGAQPSYMVAALALLPASQAPAPMLSQARDGEAGGASDVVEEFDPWEPFNEKMFSFNYKLDRYVLKPVAKGYNVVVPDRVQQMIDSGFDNLLVVQRVVNNLLQWRLKGAGVELGRFLINSTLGIGGLFDIAKQEFGLQKTRVDFGQTLGIWGMSPGPFLVLPAQHPLTVRDVVGTAVDGAMDPLGYVLPFIWTRLGMQAGNTINDRSLNLDLYQGFEETTVDLYSAVRNGYLQRRDNLIKGPPPY